MELTWFNSRDGFCWRTTRNFSGSHKPRCCGTAGEYYGTRI